MDLKPMESYLQDLVIQKDKLVDNLIEKGITATRDEKFNTLVPKVLEISEGRTISVDIHYLNIYNMLGTTDFTYTLVSNGDIIISANQRIYVYDYESKQLAEKYFTGKANLTKFQISPNGCFFCSTSSSIPGLYMYDMNTKEVLLLQDTGYNLTFIFSDNSIAAYNYTVSAAIYNLKTKTLVEFPSSHTLRLVDTDFWLGYPVARYSTNIYTYDALINKNTTIAVNGNGWLYNSDLKILYGYSTGESGSASTGEGTYKFVDRTLVNMQLPAQSYELSYIPNANIFIITTTTNISNAYVYSADTRVLLFTIPNTRNMSVILHANDIILLSGLNVLSSYNTSTQEIIQLSTMYGKRTAYPLFDNEYLLSSNSNQPPFIYHVDSNTVTNFVDFNAYGTVSILPFDENTMIINFSQADINASSNTGGCFLYTSSGEITELARTPGLVTNIYGDYIVLYNTSGYNTYGNKSPKPVILYNGKTKSIHSLFSSGYKHTIAYHSDRLILSNMVDSSNVSIFTGLMVYDILTDTYIELNTTNKYVYLGTTNNYVLYYIGNYLHTLDIYNTLYAYTDSLYWASAAYVKIIPELDIVFSKSSTVNSPIWRIVKLNTKEYKSVGNIAILLNVKILSDDLFLLYGSHSTIAGVSCGIAIYNITTLTTVKSVALYDSVPIVYGNKVLVYSEYSTTLTNYAAPTVLFDGENLITIVAKAHGTSAIVVDNLVYLFSTPNILYMPSKFMEVDMNTGTWRILGNYTFSNIQLFDVSGKRLLRSSTIATTAYDIDERKFISMPSGTIYDNLILSTRYISDLQGNMVMFPEEISGITKIDNFFIGNTENIIIGEIKNDSV